MRIAFDAKRAYQNTTGLGNYSRQLIEWLAKGYPMHQFYLIAPNITGIFNTEGAANIHHITRKGIHKTFGALWRSYFVTGDLQKLGIELYHGLSNEIPAGIRKTKIKSVVTIHDLIFERYPKQYTAVDTIIYRQKFKYAAERADRVIAISEQTKQDLIKYYNTPEDKITVCYQSCSPIFEKELSANAIVKVKEHYKLPEQYFLYVGSVIERKNLLTICKAIVQLKSILHIPLVVIGTGSSYMQEVKSYIKENGLTQDIIFLSEQPTAIKTPSFKNAADFPAIYQGAVAMIYPSIFEGFGLPVLEALWSKIPVITSNLSCLPETGGDAAYYIDPLSVTEMGVAMQKVATDHQLRTDMIAKGIIQAAKFTPQKHATNVMAVYESLT